MGVQMGVPEPGGGWEGEVPELGVACPRWQGAEARG